MSAANANGHQDEKVTEPGKEAGEGSTLENVPSEEGQTEPKDVPEATANEQTSTEIGEPADDAKELPVEDSGQELSKETQQPSKESTEQDASSGDKQSNSVELASQNAEVPDDKVLIMKPSLSFCLSNKFFLFFKNVLLYISECDNSLFVLIHLYLL